METVSPGTKRVNHEKLTRFVATAFETLGVSAAEAEIAANALVAADLRGVDTHGVIRFNPHSWYVQWLRQRSMTARPNIQVISETPSTALVDGDRGMGMVAGHRAMEFAVRDSRLPDPAIARRLHRHPNGPGQWPAGESPRHAPS